MGNGELISVQEEEVLVKRVYFDSGSRGTRQRMLAKRNGDGSISFFINGNEATFMPEEVFLFMDKVADELIPPQVIEDAKAVAYNEGRQELK